MPVEKAGKGLKAAVLSAVAAFGLAACAPRPEPPPEKPPEPAEVEKGNPLTKGEVAMLRSVFGNEIDYAKQRVVLNRQRTESDDTAAYIVTGDLHHVYFDTSHNFFDDYSRAPKDAYYAFWHEMGHIWQQQNPQKSGAYCNRVYKYNLHDGAKFSDFCTEQQGAIIADYATRFLHPRAYEPVYYTNYRITRDADARLAKVVEDAFPQAAVTRAAGVKFPETAADTRALDAREVELLRGFFGAAVEPAYVSLKPEGKYYTSAHDPKLHVGRFLYDMTMHYQARNGGARACDEKIAHEDDIYASRFQAGLEYDASVKFSFNGLCGEAQGRLMADYGAIFFGDAANPWLYNSSNPGRLTAEMKQNIADAVEAKFPEARHMREGYAAGRVDLKATVRVLD